MLASFTAPAGARKAARTACAGLGEIWLVYTLGANNMCHTKIRLVYRVLLNAFEVVKAVTPSNGRQRRRGY